MLLKGFTPISAGFYAVITLLIVSFVQKDTRLNVKKFFSALSTGSLNILSIAIVCACAGIIVSSFLITGLGMRMSSIIGTIAASSVYLALIVAAIACIILGMGMPTVGAYIIVATLGAPALIQLGFSEMGTHLFAFFYAILCNVTPPVALAAYAATPIAGEGTNPWNIGWKAFSFTLASFILPFIFIRNSALILDGSFLQIIYSLFVVFVAILSLNVAIVGYRYRQLSIVERALFVIASALLFQAATRLSSSTLSLLDFLTNIGGLCLFGALTIFQRKEVIYQIMRSHLPFRPGKAVRGSSHSAEGEAAGERQ
jgi:TRAP-type uncharacterized transport system fused permease subunit